MKKILLVNGHPVKNSYGEALAEAYCKGAQQANYDIDTIAINQLEFNPNLMYGYSKRMDLEPDLESAIELMKKADHIVWVFPIWWQGVPALLKGFVDRAMLPGIAYETKEGALPKGLFKGKTARIIVTCDTPLWYSYLFLKSPAINHFKRGVLNFVGIKPVKISYVSPVKRATDKYRQKWLNKIEQLGTKGL